MEDKLENRVIELETKFTFQEDLLGELNKIVADQQYQIERLAKSLKTITDHLKDASQGGGGNFSGDEKPPHY
jgi:SlyX protein